MVRGSRHYTADDYGLLHGSDATGAARASEGICGVRPMVWQRTDDDDAEPGFRMRWDQPGTHGRHDQDLHCPKHFRTDVQAQCAVEDLRVQPSTADQARL